MTISIQLINPLLTSLSHSSSRLDRSQSGRVRAERPSFLLLYLHHRLGSAQEQFGRWTGHLQGEFGQRNHAQFRGTTSWHTLEQNWESIINTTPCTHSHRLITNKFKSTVTVSTALRLWFLIQSVSNCSTVSRQTSFPLPTTWPCGQTWKLIPSRATWRSS